MKSDQFGDKEEQLVFLEMWFDNKKKAKRERNNLYKRAIEQWGKESQIGMMIEEIGELLTALNKHERHINGCTEEEVKDELIDVDIMLDQLKLIFFDSEIEYKEMKRGSLMHLKDLIDLSEEDLQ